MCVRVSAGVCGCVGVPVYVVNGETGDFDLHCKTNFRKPNEKNELCIQRCKHSRAAETELENRREKSRERVKLKEML